MSCRLAAEQQPEKASQAFAQGIGFAERFRETSQYDRRCPQSLGLERMICATPAKCERPEELPRDQWDNAWAQAKQRVASYYQNGKAPAGAPEQHPEPRS